LKTFKPYKSAAAISQEFLKRNRIRLVNGGEEYFSLLKSMIDNAKLTLHLQFYIFEEDKTGKIILDALLNAAKRGVSVFLQIDAYASQNFSGKMVKTLNDSGVQFKWFEPVFKSKHFYFGRRLHHKVIVADGMQSLVGGINITDRYNDLPERPAWKDMAVFCEGETTYELHKLCRHMWGSVILPDIISKEEINNKCTAIPAEECCEVRVRRNDWVTRKQQITKSYLEMFRNANNHITIMCSYFLPGRLFRKRLSQAVKRGVKVKVILAGPSDVMMAKNAERYLYEWLLKNNIEIYEYQKTVLHAKVAEYDNLWSTIGSYNVNNISAYASLELNLEIRNNEFSKKIENELEQIINQECKSITKENYSSSTNFARRIWQRFCYAFINNVLKLFTFYFKQEE
jgi:cardiolipin synthase